MSQMLYSPFLAFENFELLYVIKQPYVLDTENLVINYKTSYQVIFSEFKIAMRTFRSLVGSAPKVLRLASYTV